MNNAEASRTIAVLDDLVHGLRLLSFITTESLDSNNQLLSYLDEDTVDVLQESIGEPNSDKLKTGLHAAWRELKSAQPARVKQLQESIKLSPAMLQLLAMFDKLHAHTCKRLATTVEEDTSNRTMQAEVKERLDRSITDQQAASAKLELNRAERRRQSDLLMKEVDSLQMQLKALEVSTSKQHQGLQQAAAAEKQSDLEASDEQRLALEKQVADAQQALAAFRAEAASMEGQLRKERRRAHNELEGCIGEYDGDVGAKEKALLDAQAAHAEVLDTLQKVSAEHAALKRDRLECEERERAASQAKLKAQIKEARLDAAAYLIQNAWKCYKKRKDEVNKASKKGKDGKKGAKEGGGKDGKKGAAKKKK